MLTIKTTISMDGHGPMLVLGFTDDCIITEQQIRMTVHGKDVVEDGLSLHNIAVVKKAYTDMLFHLKYDNKQEYKKRYKGGGKMAVTLNPDKEVVRAVKEGLKRTGGYCPCRLERTEENRCMCKEFREQIADPDFEGYCHCMLYYKEK